MYDLRISSPKPNQNLHNGVSCHLLPLFQIISRFDFFGTSILHSKFYVAKKSKRLIIWNGGSTTYLELTEAKSGAVRSSELEAC
jgi:hypothetical protein